MRREHRVVVTTAADVISGNSTGKGVRKKYDGYAFVCKKDITW
jgi:hypothetical protein